MNESELEYAYRNAGMDVSHLVREPAQGVAIAKCLLNRIMVSMKATGMGGMKIRHYHPAPCKYCKVDRKNLQTIYDEWMAWSMLERDGVELPSPVESFMRLPADTQAALVRQAQGYEEKDARTDHLPQKPADPGQDPAGRNEHDHPAGKQERSDDHRSLTPTWTTGRSTGSVRSTRRNSRNP